jgi:L-alanine-DL-glutamate epimerase-like enolase superfamily enzyme
MDILDFGLTPWRKLARELGGTGIRVSPHAWALPLKTLYAAHLAACLSEADLVEGVRGQTLGVNADGCSVTKGALVLTGGPGFGVPPPQVS